MGHGHHGQVIHGPHVGPHHAVILLHARVLDAPHLQDTRVVNQHVQLTKPFHRLGYDLDTILLLDQVSPDDEGLMAA